MRRIIECAGCGRIWIQSPTDERAYFPFVPESEWLGLVSEGERLSLLKES